jgi:hypothetical protein
MSGESVSFGIYWMQFMSWFSVNLEFEWPSGKMDHLLEKKCGLYNVILQEHWFGSTLMATTPSLSAGLCYNSCRGW